MVELDFSNIYSSTGKVIQIQYAQKAADSGSTIIAMQNSSGTVMLVAKPIVSPLHVQETDCRIKKLSDSIHIAYTGILTDGFFIYNVCKRAVRNYISRFQKEPSVEFIKRTLSDYLYIFTEYSSVRVIGANFLVIMRDENKYKVLSADCSGKVTEYYGRAYGAGQRRAQTELEKLDLESMSTADMIDQGVRVLFKCFDPLSDLKFNVEAGFISDDSEGEFIKVDQTKIDEIIDKYKDVSVDDDE